MAFQGFMHCQVRCIPNIDHSIMGGSCNKFVLSARGDSNCVDVFLMGDLRSKSLMDFNGVFIHVSLPQITNSPLLDCFVLACTDEVVSIGGVEAHTCYDHSMASVDSEAAYFNSFLDFPETDGLIL